ncbi:MULTISPECIES: effector-associated domain EAD1-containing protein [Moorena]|uniref:Effector-associated domain EAD1-containing protein n=2 Tax=Moorena producens TaxID=1155739 RepID=A0A1D9G4T5_MOOP1|nr:MULTISPECIES: effector-associated domain EAD1-containing protein [Moorena]AOY82652.1 effector-associated domain EAD1-containing protein [Moorena producens JHB]EGJ28773.1 hypothetical protein LYNGBM3L_68220 [Moorena producens 3L]NEP66116.1 hypothetical protein [Moorena sp. SIO3A5]NER90941.1 hypothetical protein [Moorena sp. SIO3A2]NES40815.1 hypothetical protein [Moorena sp. SIO2C4]
MKVRNIPGYLLDQIESALFTVFPARRKNAGNTPGYLLEKIQLALLSAFPEPQGFKQMLRFQLNENLPEIATGGNFSEIVNKTINHFDSNNSLELLINSALKQNCANPELNAIKKKFKITTSLLDLLYPLKKNNKPKQEVYRDYFQKVNFSEDKIVANLNDIIDNLDTILDENFYSEKPIIDFADFLLKNRDIDISQENACQLNQWLKIESKRSKASYIISYIIRLVSNNRLFEFDYVVSRILPFLFINITGAWIIEFLSRIEWVKQYKALSMLFFIVFTIIAIIDLFKKSNLRLNQIGSVTLVILVIIGEAFIFSIFPTKLVKSPENFHNYPEIVKVFENQHLTKHYNLKKIFIHKAEVIDRFIKNPGKDNELHELHILLNDVEWTKEEKLRFLKRNYKGYIKVKISYNDNSTGKFKIKKSQIIDYSFRPGSGILSFVIGFGETAYLVPRQRYNLLQKIENIIEDNQVLEKIK